MKKTDALFQLVKSLTRGEKRNFRLLAQLTGGDKKYLKLFDVVDRLEEYEEEKVLRYFRSDAAFVRQFSVNKNYLYHSILNSLSYYRKDADAEWSSLSIQVRILVEKNLFSHAKKLLKKVKEKVEMSEQFEELLQLLAVESELERKMAHMKVLPGILRDIAFSEKVALEKLTNLLAYRHLERETAIFTRVQLMARNVRDVKAIESFTENPLLSDDARPLSVKASILYQEIRRRMALYRGDLQAVVAEGAKTIEIYEKNPAILEDDKVNYMIRLGLQAKGNYMIKRDEDGFAVLAKVRGLAISTQQERVARFEWGSHMHMALLSAQGAREEGLAFIEELESELDSIQDDLGESPRLMSYHLFASFYLCIGDYRQSLKWINRFLNTCESTFRADMQSMMRIMNLLVHYELGNRDILEYSIKSTSRFVYKKERMCNYERRLLRFFTEILNVYDDAVYQEKARELKADLTEIVKDPYEAWANNALDMISWVEAKLTGLTLADLRRARHNEAMAAARR